MLKYLSQMIAFMCLCSIAAPLTSSFAADKAYLTPNSITRKTLLKPGTSNQQLKRERYLGSRLIYSAKDPLTKLFTKDPGLSKACQRGRFLQVKEMQYIAVVDGRKYGAALYQRNMLHDPKKLADKDRLYLFKGQGTSNCRVFHKLI